MFWNNSKKMPVSDLKFFKDKKSESIKKYFQKCIKYNLSKIKNENEINIENNKFIIGVTPSNR